MEQAKPRRYSISELEALLNSDRDDGTLTILPDGTILREDGSPEPRSPLTHRQSLGGDY